MAYTSSGKQSLKDLYRPKDIAILSVTLPLAIIGAICLAYIMTSR